MLSCGKWHLCITIIILIISGHIKGLIQLYLQNCVDFTTNAVSVTVFFCEITDLAVIFLNARVVFELYFQFIF